MESISIFDIFKIGVGPSSSHTLGPWNAALQFLDSEELVEFDKIQIHLYGSLSKTGVGHATNIAVLLGLLGYNPKTIDVSSIETIVEEVKATKQITINNRIIPFDLDEDIIFEAHEHELHPNTLAFEALSNGLVKTIQYYKSVGGGFIETENDITNTTNSSPLPFPINCGEDIIKYTSQENCSISDIVYKNELALRSEKEIDQNIDDIMKVMLDCIYMGCKTEGILPGGLNVKRRAKAMCDKLLDNRSYNNKKEWVDLVKSVPKTFNSVNKWISCFALAVNEQNASLGRVVTSPTNGAAGVIPAVLMYYLLFCDYKGVEQVKKFFFTAGEIGCLFKKGATISAAVGGCQAEIGVSSAMAAGGLTEILGGTPGQCLMAAEIAMEHHLGLTCDPIKGLVQVPCIERNAMGAMKAITASNLALDRNENDAIIKIDNVIKTMWEVSNDMNHKYKETSEGGLAINVPVINPSC